MTKTNQGTAAAQEAAAPTTTSTANAATVATPVLRKAPPKARVKTVKVAKEPKRVVGVLVHIATTSYNYWRNWVTQVIHEGIADTEPRIARFVKDESALGTQWGGFIATTPENVEKVTAILNKWTEINNAKPLDMSENGRVKDMWSMMEHFVTVQPKPRVRKAKAETEATADATEATVETAETEVSLTETEVNA